MAKITSYTIIGGILVILAAVLVFVGQKGCVLDNEDESIIQGGKSADQQPVAQWDISSIRTNIIEKTSISWEVINVDTTNALSVTLRRGHPRGVPEGRTLIGEEGAEKVAKNFLVLLKNELGINSISNIVIDEIKLHDSVTIKYYQYYKGIPVYDSFGLMSMTKYGEIYSLKHIWYPNIAAPTVPEISMASVKKMALEHYKVDNIDFFEEPKLYVVSPDKLVWLVKMGEPVHRDALLDAFTGVILSERDNLMG